MSSSFLGNLLYFLFQVILRTFDVLLAPFVSVVVALVPNITDFTSGVITFVSNYVVPYIKLAVSFMYNLLGLNPAVVAFVVAYTLFLFNGKLLAIGINSIINLYNKLKV